ncbi:hypothetical protein H0H81_004760 [Sphagnurus paluster]|uniref:Protein kinase domain-containing protein n=1 Tax=Sphagnurus paluster TaxID=117069 RepID=A0A9P7FW57_9AGAR|nr:hypothetical protein H0H81_004760 [Sphagnurus paluster]
MDAKILAWTSQSSMSSKGGSVRWQAPELFSVKNDDLIRNTTASDVYAWGCVCYEIFTGQLPFEAYGDAGVIYRVMMGEQPARPAESSPAWKMWGLTEKIWLLMEKCWAKNRDERPTTEQLLQRLIPWLSTDKRPTSSGDFLPPASFRAKMGPPKSDLLSVSELECILCQDPDPGSTIHGTLAGFQLPPRLVQLSRQWEYIRKGHDYTSFSELVSRARLPASPFNNDDAR